MPPYNRIENLCDREVAPDRSFSFAMVTHCDCGLLPHSFHPYLRNSQLLTTNYELFINYKLEIRNWKLRKRYSLCDTIPPHFYTTICIMIYNAGRPLAAITFVPYEYEHNGVRTFLTSDNNISEAQSPDTSKNKISILTITHYVK